MAELVQSTKLFDFSQDAADFKAHLWQKLKMQTPVAMEPLEDDDLEWVNAAGMIGRDPADDPMG